MSARAEIMAGKAYVSLHVKKNTFDKSLMDARQRLNDFGSSLMGIGAGMAGVGTALIAPIAGAIQAASKFEESFNKFSVVFGESTKAVKAWSDNFAEEVGRSQTQIVDFMASTQDLLVPIGFEPGAATDFSKQITQLSVDLASFNNMQDTDTLRDLHAALTGSGEVMKKYGVLVSEAAVKQELLNTSIDPKTATEQQKVMARMNIILRGTTAAQGDAIRTSDSYENQMKALLGTMVDLKVIIGNAVLPSLAKLAGTLKTIIKPLADVIGRNRGVVTTIFATSAAAVVAGGSLIALGAASKAAAVGAGIMSSAYRGAQVVMGIFSSMAIVAKVATLTLTAVMAAASGGAIGYGVAFAALSALQTGYPAVAAVVLSALSSIGIALGGVTSLSGLASVAAGGMATAWTAAAGVMASAFAVITSPLIPFLAIAGGAVLAVSAIGAAAGVAAVRGADLSGVWNGLRSTLGGVMAAAQKAGSVLSQALSGGDYGIAMQAAMQGMKLAVATGVQGMIKTFSAFFGQVWGMAKTFMAEFVRLTFKTVGAVAKALANPISGGLALRGLFKDIQGMDLTLGMSFDTEGMKTEAMAELDRLQGELEKRQRERDAEAIRNEDGKKQAEEKKAKIAALQASGDLTQEEAAAALARVEAASETRDTVTVADEAAAAFDRETEAIKAQIIALREGEQAAERFRLKQQGMTDEQIRAIEAARQERDALEAKTQASERQVQMIVDYGDALQEDGKVTPEEIARREKEAIEKARAAGKIDDNTAKSAMSQADVRQLEREHAADLQAFRKRMEEAKNKPESVSMGPDIQVAQKPMSSVATTSAYALVAANQGGVGSSNPMISKLDEQIRLAREERRQRNIEHREAMAARKEQGLWHP